MSNKSILEVAKELADAHRKEDPTTTEIFLAPSKTEIRLVEVSGSLETTGEILPFRFTARPDLGIPYASVVVLLSQDDWQALKHGDLQLPEGWGTLGELEVNRLP